MNRDSQKKLSEKPNVKFQGGSVKKGFPHILAPKSGALRGDFPLQKQWIWPFELFSSNFLYSHYYLHPLGPLCKKIITVLGVFPSVTFARQNVGLIWNLNICICYIFGNVMVQGAQKWCWDDIWVIYRLVGRIYMQYIGWWDGYIGDILTILREQYTP